MQKCTKEMSGPVSEKVDRSPDYDVVIIGGAFSGSASAILLKRRFPDLKVLIVEKSEMFDRKVGESTSEVSACFLTRVLKVGRHLSMDHVGKHGLRMWFHREGDNCPSKVSEVGPAFQGRLPTFQLNRLKLDTHLLDEAVALGCELLRPATIKDIELGGVGKNHLVIKPKDGEQREITAGWVVDASGKAAMLARKLKLWHSNADQHPVNAMWSRFKKVNDLDSAKSVEAMGGLDTHVLAQRGFSTNHLMGYGWWSWIIPLDSGEVSVGLTWDERIFTPPKDGSMSERLHEHLLKHPIGKLMFQDAVAVENDNRYYKGLPYYSEKIAGDGWTIAGDAAGFMDPLYSQGLDFCSHTVYSSYALLRQHFSGECVKEEIAMRENEYKRSYFYWFDALYKNKYYYIGDAELMHVAYLLDIATYFIGPVRLVYEDHDTEFAKMPYDGPAGTFFAKFMRFYNRRLCRLAHKKIKAGKYGDKNLDHHLLSVNAFTPGPATMKLMFQGIKIWLWAELRYAFVRPSDASEATMMTPLPQAGDYKQA
ncbi:NAD(P)/FAD-dependent oxidoreductase [Verrucomicrobiaceae bacterium R5-34]|uniref:NAD(P)/FAD-dependent oxidoreductase n=1 Tax=Oceaniferula flava TaxID=2800421 RepID=A0AAE2SCL7_9BACT|nr:NAD(P)/FAD-dependent oxidoreductase [Oceaniferula flavus]MBK1831413.1 NAD(P)/FAD-dependent oxidoreductase [Verrucomicrobiaceae bacterium R5-34]MBK1854917.1 NAD(P)/FAD-dependent oxidoreductase [Oceaniferula flavus]MBM1136223.1 NAD(P)/FAD-dependent oxidoreductase [Oceaniferula flavus]